MISYFQYFPAYYDNTIFHRVVPGFIVQGGDPTGTGAGGESIYGAPFKVRPNFIIYLQVNLDCLIENDCAQEENELHVSVQNWMSIKYLGLYKHKSNTYSNKHSF